jgi:NAD-dependent DNA ligase
VGDDSAVAAACIKLTHALGELGAENVGPGLVAKMYAAGFTTIGAIYKATAAEFAATVDGCKEKGAERLWTGLRAKQATWTTLNFLVASCTMPRSVGHTKLTPLLLLNPNPATWSATEFKAAKPAGISPATIDAIVEAIPAYTEWVISNKLVANAEPAKPKPVLETRWTIVFTGVRDKALEVTLEAAGHTVADAVTKKTTHVVYADGPLPTTTKITKAEEIGAKILSLSEFRAQM